MRWGPIIVMMTTLTMTVAMTVMMVLATSRFNGNGLEVNMRAKVVPGEPLPRVRMAQECCRLGQQQTRQHEYRHDVPVHRLFVTRQVYNLKA